MSSLLSPAQPVVAVDDVHLHELGAGDGDARLAA